MHLRDPATLVVAARYRPGERTRFKCLGKMVSRLKALLGTTDSGRLGREDENGRDRDLATGVDLGTTEMDAAAPVRQRRRDWSRQVPAARARA